LNIREVVELLHIYPTAIVVSNRNERFSRPPRESDFANYKYEELF